MQLAQKTTIRLFLCVSLFLFVSLFVCLFVVFCPTREFFIHMETSITITGEGQDILIYARHSWPLSSEGS